MAASQDLQGPICCSVNTKMKDRLAISYIAYLTSRLSGKKNKQTVAKSL